MTEIELKACPFCGKPPRTCPDTSYGEALVFCPDANECDAAPSTSADLYGGETLAQAIDRWNTRPEPPLHGYAEGGWQSKCTCGEIDGENPNCPLHGGDDPILSALRSIAYCDIGEHETSDAHLRAVFFACRAKARAALTPKEPQP